MSSVSPTSGGGRKWTDAQWDAITSLGKNLLVSAAAGSGKTSVLAERCVHLVCDEPRCNVNQLLVVTFTEAAASEMKARIEQALRDRLGKSPEDVHLRRQFALIEHASISTLHSFCNRLLRQHFHRLGLDPAFRVLDGDESMLLRMEIVRDLFLEKYDSERAAEFHGFIDAFGDGDDERLMQVVVQLHEMMCSLVDPVGWMNRALGRIREGSRCSLEESELGNECLNLIGGRIGDLVRDAEAAMSALERMQGFAAYVSYLRYLRGKAKDWVEELNLRGYDGLVTAVRNLELPRLPAVPNSVPLKDAAQKLVSGIQDQFKEGPLIEALRFSSQQWQDGLRSIEPHAQVLLSLVQEFSRRYRKEKDAARTLDFADLERYALRLLMDGKTLDPTPVARMLHHQFQFVLVDEYQDINEVQDAILTLASHECTGASGRPNLFCVGDVKQSIYRFRLAEPSRFLERYDRSREPTGTGRVIDLQANFRSRKPLLDVLNLVFQRLMVREAAEIEYDQSHWLHAHAQFPPAEGTPCFAGAPIELHYLPDNFEGGESEDGAIEMERTEREALLVARRIEELMGQHETPRMSVMQRSEDGTMHPRPIEYRDIVILLRATRYHADEYADVLRQQGIPVYNTGGGGYFEAMEIRDMMSLLRLLDNQRQDIPLAAVLRSPLSVLPHPEDALARIRLAYNDVKEAIPFHEAVVRYAAEQQDELAAKLRDFLAELKIWRQLVRQRPLAELIWAIYEQTGFLAFCSGLENGQQRCANLIRLYERARQFGSFARQGLYRFIRFLESLREETDAAQASDLSEAEDVVRIMSVHKSKGLEFPVVIVPNLGKRINLSGTNGSIVADRHAGLGMLAVDTDKRIRYPSLASMLVSERLRRQTLAEELRVLYVATTRAKEHLILIGTCKPSAAESWSRAWDTHRGPLPPNAILGARTMLDWLGPVAASLAGESADAIQVFDHPAEEVAQWSVDSRQGRPSERFGPLAGLRPLEPAPAANDVAERVIARLKSVYPHQALAALRASMPVTSFAKHGTGGNGEGSASGETLDEPRFLREAGRVEPTEKGTAVHLFMEHLDYARPCDEPDLRRQLAELVERKLMSAAQAGMVDPSAVLWFVESEVGQLLRQNPAGIRRELPMNYALPPSHVSSLSSDDVRDQVMVRGRIDLLFEDEKGFVLVDYKTDNVDESGIPGRCEMYQPQVDLYRAAIQRITGKKVHTVYLAFLTPRKNVLV